MSREFSPAQWFQNDSWRYHASLLLICAGLLLSLIHLRLAVYSRAVHLEASVQHVLAVLQGDDVIDDQHEARWREPSMLHAQQLEASISAEAALVWDLERDTSIFSMNADQRYHPGSLVKLMTALVSVQEYDLEEVVSIDREVFTIGTVIDFRQGVELTVSELLTALLIQSGNDAALALADHHPGGYEAFVRGMNTKAKELGMNNTQFTNPSGLDESLQQTTVSDLQKLSVAVLSNPKLKNRMGERSARVCTVNETNCYQVWHTHQLLSQERILVGKTGTTPLAGEALITVTVDDILIILLQSENRYADTELLLNHFSPL